MRQSMTNTDLELLMQSFTGREPCRQPGVDPDLWFPEPTSRLEEYLPALQLCRTCPIQSECATYALRHREEVGIWGGLTEADRGRIHKRLRGGAA